MSNIVISVENLSKVYRLGQIGTGTLTNDLRVWWAKMRGQPNPLLKIGQADHGNRTSEDLYALRDVSFSVEQGEVLGIIGRNGAGKSTLLKILSRVTAPTSGLVKVRGRIASLLEVGTGFHPELTGRENVYLNGAILGMKRAEIDRKFDEIVAFAEIEKFLDTPVKRYSSGMYVRLAFAVAAHLEPEILVVDEVLAVGDAAFQEKCLGKMSDVARHGRTVLFVSHNMAAIISLCSKVNVITGGRFVCEDNPEAAVEHYLQSAKAVAGSPIALRADRQGTGQIRITEMEVSGAGHGHIRCDDRLSIDIAYESERMLSGVKFLVGIYDHMGRSLYFLDSEIAGGLPANVPKSGHIKCLTGPINITPGPISVNVAAVVSGDIADHVVRAATLQIEPIDFYGTGKISERQFASCLLSQNWFLESDLTK